MRKIIQALKIGSKLIRYKISKKRIPLMANLLLTNRCNLKCFYCYPQVVSRKINDITVDKWLEVIDTLRNMGCEIIVLLGGEPLLYNGIEQIVERAREYGMVCEMITNGYYVKQKTDLLRKLDSVCISVDGDEATNDRNRGQGAYKKAVEAINHTVSLGIRTRIKAVITKRNIGSFDYLCRFAKDNRVTLTFTLPSIHTENEDLRLDPGQIKELLTLAKEYKRKGFPIAHTITSLDLMLQWPYNYYSCVNQSSLNEDKKVLPCIRNDLTCYIDADGMIYPCAILWSDFSGKNFLETGIHKAWENLSSKPCYSCGYIGELELNLLLSLSVKNIAETACYYFRR